MSKKQIEYGPELGPIEFWYVGWANTLDSAGTEEGAVNALLELTTISDMRVLHAAMGLVTEASEIMDALKKKVFYHQKLDRDNLLEEVGDILWYVALIAKELGEETLTPIMEANYRKLTTRYGKKWSQDAALNRDTQAEMSSLTSTVDSCPICTHANHQGSICLGPWECECRGLVS